MASFPILHQKVKRGGGSPAPEPSVIESFCIYEDTITTNQLPVPLTGIDPEKAKAIYNACARWWQGDGSVDISVKIIYNTFEYRVKMTDIYQGAGTFRLRGYLAHTQYAPEIELTVTPLYEISGRIMV